MVSDHEHNWATIKHWGKGAIVDHLVSRHGFKREDLEGQDLLAMLREAHEPNEPEKDEGYNGQDALSVHRWT